MILRTPISYYGGKQRMLQEIKPLVPKHKIYGEPFMGGGALFFSKPPSSIEVINDSNGNVVNFYQVMKNNFDELLHLVNESLYSEQLHKDALRIYKSNRGYSRIKKAWAFWFVTNFSYANKPGGGWKFDNGTKGSHIGVTFHRKKDEFKLYANRLDKVQICRRDAIQVVKDRDFADTFLFLDPPYINSDQGHYKGYKQKDFDALIKALSGFKGKFMICHYYNPNLLHAARENDWHIHSFDMRCSAPKEANRRKTEMLVMNYQPLPSLFDNI